MPVFVDIRPDTLNIDERLIEQAITPRTKAIVVVHYAGVACEMDAIMAIAAAHGFTVIEDAAQASAPTYQRPPARHARAPWHAVVPRDEEHPVRRGRGAPVNDPSLAARAEIIREKGTNRSRFFRGEVDKYTWVDAGSSYLPAEILAAFLTAQLESFDAIQEARMATWDRYSQEPVRVGGRQRRGCSVSRRSTATGSSLRDRSPRSRDSPAVHRSHGERRGEVDLPLRSAPLRALRGADRGRRDPAGHRLRAAGLARLPSTPTSPPSVDRVIEQTLAFVG